MIYQNTYGSFTQLLNKSTFQQHLTAISEGYVDTKINKRRYSMVKCIEIYTDIKFQHGHDETK
jgi:hypothetical protein